MPHEVELDIRQDERASAKLPTGVDDDDVPPAIPSRKPRSGSNTDNRANGKGSKPDPVKNAAEESNPVYCGGDYYDDTISSRPVKQYSYEMTIPGAAQGQSYTSLADIHSDRPTRNAPFERFPHDHSDMDSFGEDATTSCSHSRHDERVGLSSDQSSPPIPPLPQKWTNPVAKETAVTSDDVTNSGSRMARYVIASEVPPDEDAENWTISDVTEALRLLKMSQYGEMFREREIDGALLCSLDERTLVEDFGFKLFEATKFFMFVRKGWRPK